jgi:hypothetical protein
VASRRYDSRNFVPAPDRFTDVNSSEIVEAKIERVPQLVSFEGKLDTSWYALIVGSPPGGPFVKARLGPLELLVRLNSAADRENAIVKASRRLRCPKQTPTLGSRMLG